MKKRVLCLFVFIFVFLLSPGVYADETVASCDYTFKFKDVQSGKDKGDRTIYVYFLRDKKKGTYVKFKSQNSSSKRWADHTIFAFESGSKDYFYCPRYIYINGYDTSGDNHLELTKGAKGGFRAEYVSGSSNVYVYESQPEGNNSDNAQLLKCDSTIKQKDVDSLMTDLKSIKTSADTIKTLEEINIIKTKYGQCSGKVESYKTNRVCAYIANDNEKYKVLSNLNDNVKTALDDAVKRLSETNAIDDETSKELTENLTESYNKIKQNIPHTMKVASYPTPYSCNELLDQDLKDVIQLVLKWIRILVPILLIVLTAVDFAQCVISQDNDAIKKAVSKVIKRGIAALGVFFIPLFVSVMIDWLDDPAISPLKDPNDMKCEEALK